MVSDSRTISQILSMSAKVLRKRSRGCPRGSPPPTPRSPSPRSAMGKRPKLKLPVLKVAISGRSSGRTAALSSSVMPLPPPVVGCTITSHRSLMPATTSRKSSRDELGLPDSGSRTWRCTIAAPASWAPTAESIISSGVNRRALPRYRHAPGDRRADDDLLHVLPLPSQGYPRIHVKVRAGAPQTCQLRDPPPRGARFDRPGNDRGPHSLSPVLEGRAELPVRPCAS